MDKIIGAILMILGIIGILGVGLYVLCKIHVLLGIGLISFIALITGSALGSKDFEISACFDDWEDEKYK